MLFRKKPVVVEAVQMTRDVVAAHVFDGAPLPEGVKMVRADIHRDQRKIYSSKFVIKTLEGDMEVSWDDWVIIGVKGERYPCKPDIFEATYDPVPEPQL